MGNSVSGSSATHEAELKATGNVRKFCDEIMKYMIERLNIADFYRLASRTECNKYVIFLANKLDTTFRGLSFAPTRGKAGKLYFQPISQLQKPTAKEKAERESLCLFLAYFYVRIFQIYGAIALTLIDDANVYVQTSKDQLIDTKSIQFDRDIDFYGPPGAPNPLPKPGLAGYFESPTDKTFGSITEYRRSANSTRRNDSRRDYDRQQIVSQFGGDVFTEKKLGKFKLFNKLVSGDEKSLQIIERSDKKENVGYLFNIPNFKGSFRPDTSRGFATSEESTDRATLFFDAPHGASTNFYTISISVVTGGGRRESGNYLKILRVNYRSLIEDLNRTLLTRGQTYPTDKTRDLTDSELSSIFEKIFDVRNSEFRFEEVGREWQIFVKTRSEGIPVSKFIVTLKSIFDEELGLKRRGQTNYTRRNERGIVTASYDENIKAVFDPEPINALRTRRPIPMCSALAFKLLGNKMGDIFTPAICETKFLVQEKDGKILPRDTAIPDNDKSIDDSDGIQLLVQLFSDESEFRKYRITKSVQSMNSYMDFLIRMTKVYRTKDNRGLIKQYMEIAANKNPKEKLAKGESYSVKTIKNELAKDACNNYRPVPIEIKSAKGAKVLDKVGKLFGAQIAHANRCGQILKQLFTIVNVSGIQSIVINRNIFLKGIGEVNRINRITRDTLVKYYENCQRIYLEGVEEITKVEKSAEEKPEDSKAVPENSNEDAK
jgi:hypothetical protein